MSSLLTGTGLQTAGAFAQTLPRPDRPDSSVPGLGVLSSLPGISAPGFTGSSSATGGEVSQQGGTINFGGSGGGANSASASAIMLILGVVAVALFLKGR